jgi:protein-tyrosine phosphatase
VSKPRALALGIGIAGAACALGAATSSGVAAWLLAWTALSCFVVAWAYAANRPGVFGKREDGRVRLANQLLLLPYLAVFHAACWLIRLVRPLPPVDEVAAGVYVGGRLRESAIPPDVELVLDLVAEFPGARAVRSRPGYRCLPVLDGHHPRSLESFLGRTEEAAAAPGGVLIHCESGVGRAPTAAAVLLVARGLVPDPASAVELIAKRRPKIHPTRSDRDFMERAVARLG